jgi:hypothetical protein
LKQNSACSEKDSFHDLKGFTQEFEKYLVTDHLRNQFTALSSKNINNLLALLAAEKKQIEFPRNSFCCVTEEDVCMEAERNSFLTGRT